MGEHLSRMKREHIAKMLLACYQDDWIAAQCSATQEQIDEVRAGMDREAHSDSPLFRD